MPNRQTSQENMVLGSLEQAIPEGSETCPDFPVQVSEVKMKPTDADHHPLIIVLAAVWRADLPLPDHTSRSPRRSGQANDAPIRGQLRSGRLWREHAANTDFLPDRRKNSVLRKRGKFRNCGCRVHAKGVVLCEKTCFCLLSTF